MLRLIISDNALAHRGSESTRGELAAARSDGGGNRENLASIEAVWMCCWKRIERLSPCIKAQ
jgi:hypothetical protein